MNPIKRGSAASSVWLCICTIKCIIKNYTEVKISTKFVTFLVHILVWISLMNQKMVRTQTVTLTQCYNKHVSKRKAPGHCQSVFPVTNKSAHSTDLPLGMYTLMIKYTWLTDFLSSSGSLFYTQVQTRILPHRYRSYIPYHLGLYIKGNDNPDDLYALPQRSNWLVSLCTIT